MALAYLLFVLLRSILRAIEQRKMSQARLDAEITRRLQMQEELVESRELIETVVSSAPVILFAINTRGRITLCRGKGLDKLGLGGRTLAGEPLDTVLGGSADLRHCQGRALAGEMFSTTFTVRDLSLECWFAPFRNREQAIIGAIGLATDVTAIKQAEQELIRSKEAAEANSVAKSNFLANISHELRTPLNSVIGFAILLQKNQEGTLSGQDLFYAERIRENGNHLLEIINQVLDLSKIETGHMDVKLSDVDAADLIGEVFRTVEHQARGKGLALSAEITPRLAPLTTDVGKLRQILLNLVGNAIKFTSEGSVIVRVHGEPDQPPFRIDVIDTGVGIPEDKHLEIFQAFHQLDNQASRKHGGTGLGLTICLALCQTLGYELDIASRTGEGATFSIVLSHERVPLATV